MSTTRIFSTNFRLCFVALLLVAACQGEISHLDGDSDIGITGVFPGSNGNTGGNSMSNENATLSVLGEDTIILDTGGEARLRVRFVNQDGFPIVGKIMFEFVGNGFGSALESSLVDIDSSGMAEVKLRAGNTNSQFRVKALTSNSLSVLWDIKIVDGASVTPRGTYEINSVFNGIEDTPGALGDTMEWAVEITDDPGDPGKWLLEKLDSSLIDPVIDILSPIVNAALLTNYPQTYERLNDFGEKVQDLAKHFGLRTTMRVYSGTRDDFGVINTRADHEIDAFVVKVDGNETVYNASSFYSVPQKIRGIDFEYNTQTKRIEIEEHEIPIPYGTVLARAIEGLVVPAVSPESESLEELFSEYIDCDAVSVVLAEELPPHSGYFYKALCRTVIEQTADEILENLAKVDERSLLILEVRGTGSANDNDDDSKIDEFYDGKWRGRTKYDGRTESIPYSGRDFFGKRD